MVNSVVASVAGSVPRRPWAFCSRTMHSVIDDSLVYRRGTTAAIAGLVIQIGLTLATALVGLWTQSPAIQAATWHMLGGLPIWIILALVYAQYDAERRESLAAEKLATQDAASSVLFGDLSDELQRARQRLANLLGYGLPGVSFLVAVYLIVAGAALLWRFWRLAAAAGPSVVITLAPSASPVGLLFVSATIAFVAFISARWISGYTRVRAWRLLRGGASYLMSCFVLAALVLAGAVVAALLDDTSFFRIVAVAVPCVMMLVGVEILLTGLLEAYRPRRPGEVPRPADGPGIARAGGWRTDQLPVRRRGLAELALPAARAGHHAADDPRRSRAPGHVGARDRRS